jgi:serine/threonine protein kinase
VDEFATVEARGKKRPTPNAMVELFPEIPGYDIYEELGRGGMGVVYLARQHGLNRRVALKTLLPGAREPERFRTEAQAVARLQHPNIVQVFEVGEWAPHPHSEPLAYFSMELCQGGSLDDALDGSPLPPMEAAQLCMKVARAVQHAHEHGVIHRDLKPANVLLAGDAVAQEAITNGAATAARGASDVTAVSLSRLSPKVADFGLAKRLDEEQGQTRTGDVMGTPAYMAPEQARGQKAGPEADIWALGAILYECLTGRPPFRAPTAVETMYLVLNQEPVAPSRLNPRVPRDLETIALKCLAKDSHRRYATAGDMADDLGRFLGGLPIHARPLGPVGRLLRWARRYPLAATLIVFLAALTIFSLGVSVSLLNSKEAFRHTLDRIEDRVGQLRGEVEEWQGKVTDAQDRLQAAQQAHDNLCSRYARAQAELAGLLKQPGGEGKGKLPELRIQEAELARDVARSESGVAKLRHQLSQVTLELEVRQRWLAELEHLLNPKDGPPMPPPRPRSK